MNITWASLNSPNYKKLLFTKELSEENELNKRKTKKNANQFSGQMRDKGLKNEKGSSCIMCSEDLITEI